MGYQTRLKYIYLHNLNFHNQKVECYSYCSLQKCHLNSEHWSAKLLSQLAPYYKMFSYFSLSKRPVRYIGTDHPQTDYWVYFWCHHPWYWLSRTYFKGWMIWNLLIFFNTFLIIMKDPIILSARNFNQISSEFRQEKLLQILGIKIGGTYWEGRNCRW